MLLTSGALTDQSGADMTILTRAKRSHMERFEQYAIMQPNGCREWQGGKLADDYGSFRYENKSWPAHRWIWTRTFGRIPAGMVVRHKCDNPPCANIAHLELGTVAANMQDMVDRNRSLKGSKNAIAKLNESSVLEIKIAIRDRSSKQKDLAIKYGVTPMCISHIALGRSWKHVTIEAE